MAISTEYGTVQVEVVGGTNGWDVLDVDTNVCLGHFKQRYEAMDLAVYVNDLVAELETRAEQAEQDLRDYREGVRRSIDSFLGDLDID
jgi:hypothetical protein